MVSKRKSHLKAMKESDDHCKVVWMYNGLNEDVPAMYDKPRRLCRWWVREHRNDAQYAKGLFKVVSIVFQTKTS